MARSMLSLGIFSFLAARTAVRRRGLEFGSPPPMRAAMVSSRMRRVKTRPRFASVAAFLCLMVAHFECPDMTVPSYSEILCARKTRDLSLESCSEPLPLRGAGQIFSQTRRVYHSRSATGNPLYSVPERVAREIHTNSPSEPLRLLTRIMAEERFKVLAVASHPVQY